MESLQQKYYTKYSQIDVGIVRNYIHRIDWSNRLIGIKGARGVGKTTLILQYLKLNYSNLNESLYVSLDDFYFAENKLYALAENFYQKGGKILAVDEVHRYPNWSVELKNIYDDFPNLKLIFTGSSLLHIRQSKADLSRRAVMYEMAGLSFREFVRFQTDVNFQAYDINTLLENHVAYAMEISNKIQPLAYFADYLHHGYYPFYLENVDSYHSKLEEVIHTVLEIDIPQFASLPAGNIQYLRKLLRLISQSVPFKPNMTTLSSRTGISLNTLKAYLKLLRDAGIISMLYVEGKGVNSLNKPEKVYLNNPNLMYNQATISSDKGSVRESFFFNQVSNMNEVYASKSTDFLVSMKYEFEIGGKNKTRKQIQNLTSAYVVKDDIVIGSDNVIPLWLFGFLY